MDQPERPKIVCLCGSTKFYEAFMEANCLETMRGHIVLSVGFFTHRPDTHHGKIVACTPEQKIALDELHKRKIDLCDERSMSSMSVATSAHLRAAKSTTR